MGIGKHIGLADPNDAVSLVGYVKTYINDPEQTVLQFVQQGNLVAALLGRAITLPGELMERPVRSIERAELERVFGAIDVDCSSFVDELLRRLHEQSGDEETVRSFMQRGGLLHVFSNSGHERLETPEAVERQCNHCHTMLNVPVEAIEDIILCDHCGEINFFSS